LQALKRQQRYVVEEVEWSKRAIFMQLGVFDIEGFVHTAHGRKI